MNTYTPTMSVYNEFFQRVNPRNSSSLQLKRAWDMWYSGLSWYERNVGSAHTLRDARARIMAFKTMNNEPQFGEEPVRQTIKLGSTGQSVSAWQKVLGLKETGIFDTATHEATKNYQMSRNLTPDGIVGPATWSTVRVQKPVGASLVSYFKSKAFIGGAVALVAGGVAAFVFPRK